MGQAAQALPTTYITYHVRSTPGPGPSSLCVRTCALAVCVTCGACCSGLLVRNQILILCCPLLSRYVHANMKHCEQNQATHPKSKIKSIMQKTNERIHVNHAKNQTKIHAEHAKTSWVFGSSKPAEQQQQDQQVAAGGWNYGRFFPASGWGRPIFPPSRNGAMACFRHSLEHDQELRAGGSACADVEVPQVEVLRASDWQLA